MQMKFSDGQSEFSWVFNFTILGYSRKIIVLQYQVGASITAWSH